jgi:DNA repair protein
MSTNEFHKPDSGGLTVEQVKRIESNKTRALEKRRLAESSPLSSPSGGFLGAAASNQHVSGAVPPFALATRRHEDQHQHNRHVSTTSSGSRPPGLRATHAAAIPVVDEHWTPSADSTIMSGKRKLVDYDLSKMIDTRGGFLATDPADASAKASAEMPRPPKRVVNEAFRPPINPDLAANPVCKECGSLSLDHELVAYYGVNVCSVCRQAKPEKFTQLTKTEVKLDYLLTDSELRDKTLLPHMVRPNPHKSTYANMLLYLREQVEEFAFKKWGGEEGLDQEWERRVESKKDRKEKQFQNNLWELRRRTRTSLWAEQQYSEDEEGKFSDDNEKSTSRPEESPSQLCQSPTETETLHEATNCRSSVSNGGIRGGHAKRSGNGARRRAGRIGGSAVSTHVHEWEELDTDGGDGNQRKSCKTCGIQIEEEEL